jgi:hypothetical protein
MTTIFELPVIVTLYRSRDTSDFVEIVDLDSSGLDAAAVGKIAHCPMPSTSTKPNGAAHGQETRI